MTRFRSKNQYQNMIHTYMKRREHLKQVDRRKYADRIKQMSMRIKRWRNQIRRIEATIEIRTKAIDGLIKSINDYFNVDIRIRKKDVPHSLARNVFYKYGLENNFKGSWLNSSLNRKWCKASSDGRMRFTKSFKTNPKNKEAYEKFKHYYIQN